LMVRIEDIDEDKPVNGVEVDVYQTCCCKLVIGPDYVGCSTCPNICAGYSSSVLVLVLYTGYGEYQMAKVYIVLTFCIIFPLGKPVEPNVKRTMYDELLKRLQAKAGKEEIKVLCRNYQWKQTFTPNPPYSHTISNTPKLIRTTILVDRNSLDMDVVPFLAASILSPNLLVFPNSSPKVAITKSIYDGLALPCCHWSNGCDYYVQSRLLIPRLEREWMPSWAPN